MKATSAATIASAIEELQQFAGPDLGRTISSIEETARGVRPENCEELLRQVGASNSVLGAAALVKSIAGQINVTIHTLGILRCLPSILEDGEVIEYVSLGAGNTGREFDLETNFRIAEFKFIRWQGGAEVIRQATRRRKPIPGSPQRGRQPLPLRARFDDPEPFDE